MSGTAELQSGAAGSGGSPEIGALAESGSISTNYHDVGTGTPVLLIHGSGPGVSAWANWRLVLPRLAEKARIVAPDMAGFGYTQVMGAMGFDLDLWLDQVTGLLDALDLPRVAVVGNSFGGAIALHLASRCPERVSRLVLMGSVGVEFPLTPGLDRVWGYEPSFENMAELIRLFAYDQSIATDDLIELRYRASIREDVQQRFAALFPAPRQRWVDELALDEERLKAISQPVLLLHGCDDQIIPIAASRRLATLIPDSRLIEISDCGHWVQIEQTDVFLTEVTKFLEL